MFQQNPEKKPRCNSMPKRIDPQKASITQIGNDAKDSKTQERKMDHSVCHLQILLTTTQTVTYPNQIPKQSLRNRN